ncbi:MAG: queuosine precursor transporter [Cytophagales bacterium]|nr:queuosine precursor transporter [Cytophagales bacterium]
MFGSQNTNNEYILRRERVFLVLAGLFLGSLTMLNILGISRILDLSFVLWGQKIPLQLTVGVLAYPITFLCTDLISELYGAKRANSLVWVGLILNLWVLFILWAGSSLPKMEGTDDTAFLNIRDNAYATVLGSMVAYLLAQFCDVKIFHFLKERTQGKHLWLRNNGSTLVSQLIDSTTVILIAHFFANAFNLEGNNNLAYSLTVLILSGYVFKLVTALLDTIPFYLCVKALKNYLNIESNEEI